MEKLRGTGMKPQPVTMQEQIEWKTITHGLLMQDEWRNMIFQDGKTWEVRGSNTARRGRIALITGQYVYGSVNLVTSHPLAQWHFEQEREKHKVLNWSWVMSRYKRPHAWVMANPLIYAEPRKVQRRHGQVIWVKFDR